MARQYFVEIGQPQRSALHRAPPELPRQHAGRAGGRRQRLAAALFAPLLIDVTHVSPCYAYRDQRADETPEAYGARLAAELDAAIAACGAEARDRLRRRNRRRRHRRRADAGAGLLRGGARGLRPPRRPADPRRGDVRHGPHRHAPRVRAGRRRARPDDRSRRAWAAATSRSARCSRRKRSSTRCRAAAASSSTATPTSATRSPAPRRWRCSR